MKDIIEKLCNAPGVSGYEHEAAAVFEKLVAPYCSEIKKDAAGNVIAVKKSGRHNAVKIMIEAHTDKIGLMVKHITDDGCILFSRIGGIDTKIIPAGKVVIYGREKIYGVIGAVPPHVSRGDGKKAPKAEDLCVDTGLSAQKLAELVSVGDVMEFDTSFTQLLGKRIAASACDDRAGVAILVKCLMLLQNEQVDADVYAVAAVQEEVGLRGAGVATTEIEPDIAICVDVCHGKTPDASDNVFEAGGGTVITVGPNIHPEVSDRLISLAREKEIAYQIDADGGDTGTDTWIVQVRGKGVKTGLLSIPLRYMHTPYEVMDSTDAEATASLICEFIKGVK